LDSAVKNKAYIFHQVRFASTNGCRLFIFCIPQRKGKTLRGTTLACGMLSAINSTMGKTASLIINRVSILNSGLYAHEAGTVQA
jgi:hypothetical protein